jgi:DNA helicase HerA-like ATPase
MAFALPTDNQRITIIGSTGSGKTRAGFWNLAYRSYDKMPWIVFDFKGEELFSRLEDMGLATEILIKNNPPKKPGVYIIRPLLRTEEDRAAINDYLWKIWKNGKTGIFIDEGYMLARSLAYRQIQTQGRSLKIPTITLSQRPKWMDIFVFSEADFIQVFRLNFPEDRKTAKTFVNFDLDFRLPDFYSVYYNVSKDKAQILTPVPSDDEILSIFKSRIQPRLKFA